MIADLVRQDLVLFAGYSAGPCVAGPALDGLEAVDDPTVVTSLYGAEPIWSGLGLVDFRVVPHIQSPSHAESAALDAVAERYRAEQVPHITLRDGEAFVIDEESTTIVGSPATVDELLY